MKVILGCFLVFFALIPNPLYWPAEISKRMDLDRSSIITPNEPIIINLNSTVEFWDYLSNYTTYNSSEFKVLDVETKLEIYEQYILFKVEYSYDFNNYYVNIHTATPKEVLERGKDDCQGQCVVMVSFLQYLGYDAWCAETPFHWYTRVFINGSIYVDLNRGSACEPLSIFNGKEVRFPISIWINIYNVIFYRSDYVAGFYEDFINMMSPFLSYLLLFGISLIISSLSVLVIKYPKKYNNRQWLNSVLFGTGLLYMELILVYIIALFSPTFFFLSILIGIFIYLLLIDREIIIKATHKN